MKKTYPPIYYSDYLQLDKLLDAQNLKSDEYELHAHDEMLFIIVHQAYELWFKQILFELDSVMEMFATQEIEETKIGKCVARLRRITAIQRLLIEQISVLETMTPLDFLDFRDFLVPASGFQSVQFRIIENKLGLRPDSRITYNNKSYYSVVSNEHQEILKGSEKEKSFLELIDDWLSRTPFLNLEGFSFWEKYKDCIEEQLLLDKEIIEKNPSLSDEKKKKQLEEFEKTIEHFRCIIKEDKYNELVKNGQRKLSHKAFLAALFINLYRDEPILHLPFRFLNYCVDIDENFTTWRYKHALMVHRMIGAKVGTGGSSGHHYLLQTAEKHKVFRDLFDLSTYLVPSSSRPELPESLKKELGFYFTYKK